MPKGVHTKGAYLEQTKAQAKNKKQEEEEEEEEEERESN